MTKEVFDSLYLGRAIHCDTEEKAKEFLVLADSVGYRWFGDVRATEFTKWEKFKDDTHYFIKSFWEGIYIECGDSDYYSKYNIDCIEFIPQSQKLKVGDRVRIIGIANSSDNGKIGIIKETGMLSGFPYSVIVDGSSWIWRLSENNLEKVEEPKTKEETAETLIDEIKVKWHEINILLNRLEKKQKGE